MLYRYCLRWDLGFSYEECGHVLKGDSGQLTPGRQKILVKDRTAFILAPKKELDPNTYTIHGPEDLSNLPFTLTLEPTPLETMTLIERGQMGSAALYIGLSVALSVLGLAMGLWLMRSLVA